MRMIAFAASAAALALLPVASAEAAPQKRAGWSGVPHATLKPPMRGHGARGQVTRWGGGKWHGGGRWTGGKWHGGRWHGSGHRWGGRWQGRWHGGWFAPGGWGGYRPAFVGYQLPSYWIAPGYALSYQTYGLPAPRAGYGWSRYYDDAVMIDPQGRVHDLRRGIDWDRYEGGYAPGDTRYDAPYDDEFDGPGDPDGAWDRDRYDDDRRPPPGAPYPLPGGDDYGAQSGRWSGTWQGEADGRPYTYDGTFDGEWRPDAPPPYAAPYGEPPYAPLHAPGRNPAIVPSGSTVIINGIAYPGGGSIANGFYYPPPTLTTITVAQPAVARTVTYETVHAPAKRWKAKPKKRWKPKTKCHC